jgi:hypothetical protein
VRILCRVVSALLRSCPRQISNLLTLYVAPRVHNLTLHRPVRCTAAIAHPVRDAPARSSGRTVSTTGLASAAVVGVEFFGADLRMGAKLGWCGDDAQFCPSR